MVMLAERWGERRERARRTRRWLIAVGMGAVAFGFVALVPEHAALPTKSLAMTIAMTAVLIGGWLSWRERDEVERQRAMACYATIGFTALISFPLMRISAPLLGIADPGMTAWVGSVVAGLAAYGVCRLRG